jgi:hypothetical protein
MNPNPVPLIALLLLTHVSAAQAADPTDNPVAAFYPGPEGYPAWTDGLRWDRVINMKTYTKGKTDYDKFLKARDEFSEGGGVMYYPAGTYDFSTMPAGVGLLLTPGVIIRGEAPSDRPLASEGKLELATKFVFAFRERGGGDVPRDFNFIGLQPDDRKAIKAIDQVGIAWVHLVGATVNFGPQMDWGKTWGSAKALMSDKVKKEWGRRDPSGTHPFDALAGGGKKYVGAGKGRLIFGCVFEDAAVLDDYLDPGYGADGFQASLHCARIIAYGSRVLVANNLLPRSRHNFKYRQKTSANAKGKGDSQVLFDYGRTCGIDINKDLLICAAAEGTCPGYFEEGIVVRDNYVFNHGHKGYNISGNWVTITDNKNERVYLRAGQDAYGLGTGWTLTRDGYEVAGATSDNSSRAFDPAGRNLWIDGNAFNNTGSSPGSDGEGIACRAAGGTPIFSWAITHNIHTRGNGDTSSIGGSDADCHGLLIAWNQTTGWVGNSVKRDSMKMTDCAFVANKCGRIHPDDKTVARFGITAPITASPSEAPKPPTKVTAAVYQDDAVKITWTDASDNEVGFRVDRRLGDGKWHVIAYRPPRIQGDADNAQEWVDFTAPPRKELTYRVVAINADDNDKGASEPTEKIRLSK